MICINWIKWISENHLKYCIFVLQITFLWKHFIHTKDNNIYSCKWKYYEPKLKWKEFWRPRHNNLPTPARCMWPFLLFLRSPIYTHDTIWWRTRWKWKGYILCDVFCHTNANHHSSSFQHLHPHSLWLALHFQSQAIVVKRWCYVPSSFEMHEIGKRNRNERIQVF